MPRGMSGEGESVGMVRRRKKARFKASSLRDDQCGLYRVNKAELSFQESGPSTRIVTIPPLLKGEVSELDTI